MRRALLALCLVLAGCAAPGQPESPLSPLGAGAFVSPLNRAARYRVALPLVEGQGYTAHCVALDTWAGSVEAQLASAGEGECFHVWFTPTPLPDGLWAACRSVEECERLDIERIARERPGATVLLLNEPNNSDTAGGGWPVSPATAAARLRPVADKLRAAGLRVACCGLYFDKSDSLSGRAWWVAYTAAGGLSDLRHYHIFGRTADDAEAARRLAERAMPPPWIISESGWCRGVADYVQGIESPRYAAVFSLRSAGRCR